MKPRLSKFIIRTILNPKAKTGDHIESYSDYDLAKGWYQLKLLTRGLLMDIGLISIGVVSAGFGLKGFLLNNGFLDGGATGISLLLAQVTGTSLSILLLLVNLPFLILGLRVIGKAFAIKAMLAIIGLAIVVAILPYPEITQDKLLIAVFGGFFLGTGIGLSIRGGAVIDGTEVLAIALSRRLGISIGDIILIINVIVFSFGAYLVNIETALYAMLTYLSASKTVDFLLEGIEEYTGVTIVSNKAEEIKRMISLELNYGVTVFKGERGFGKTGEKHVDSNILYTVLTRLEINRLKKEVQRIDPNAFLVMNSIKDTVGGMTKKRRHKH
ncbi:MAG: YitT family protein [Saprospiraceae bacterium]|nr:YitT family protein [Saprospiraceae bacterium]